MKIMDTIIDLIKYKGNTLTDDELKKLGETHVNFFIKFFKKLVLSKPKVENYFLNRGISVVKQRNLDFIKAKFPISQQETDDIKKFLPDRMLLSEKTSAQASSIHGLFNLKKQIDSQRNNDPDKKHWVDNFVDSASLGEDDSNLNHIAQLNLLYIENENWLTHEEFAGIIKKIGKDFSKLDSSKIDLLAKSLRFSVSSDQKNKKLILKGLLDLGDKLRPTLEFYEENPQLFKELISSLPSKTSSQEVGRRMLNLQNWEDLRSKPNGKVFFDELGVKYISDASPESKSKQVNDIKKLFDFFNSAIERENLKPDILAKALDMLIQNKNFHQAVEDLGSYFSVFIKNDAEKELLSLYAKLEKGTIQEVQQEAIQPRSFEDTLNNDPFKIAQTLLPPFLAKIETDPASIEKLNEGLKAIAPLANALILSEDVKTYLVRKEGKLNKKFGTIKIVLTSLSGNKAEALHFGKNIIKGNFESKEGVSQFLINTLIEANALFIKRKELSGKELKQFNENLSPLQLWLLDGLPQLTKKTPFINTLTNIGTSFLGTRVGQFVGGAIGASVLKGFIADTINNSTLTDEQKKGWIQNKDLWKGVDQIVDALIPLIPKIKEKHDLDFYFKALGDISALIHSTEPVNTQKVADKLAIVVNHFLDKDLVKYEDSLFAVLDEVPKLG